MTNYSGFIVQFDEGRRAILLERLSKNHEDFTDAFSRMDWEFGGFEVCLLSFGAKYIEFACLAKRGREVATEKYQVKFSNFVELNNLTIDDIEKSLSTNIRHHFVKSTSGTGARLTPQTWRGVLEEIRRRCPEKMVKIEELLRMRMASLMPLTGVGAEIVGLQRDAVGVALDVFDVSTTLRKEVLTSWMPPSVDQEMPPFLAGLTDIKRTEEQILAHDIAVFPDLRGDAIQIGMQFRTADRALTVTYHNRDSVEKSIGVDMIYFNHTFRSYTLVQYKRFNREESRGKQKWAFRPIKDKNFSIEMSRMADFCVANPDNPNCITPTLYRLSHSGFYIKFCHSIVTTPLSTDLTPGIYLPREYVELLLSLDSVKGAKDGVVFTYENVGRYLTNTTFAALVRDGWIGTRGIPTDEITNIIKNSLKSKHALLLASSEESTT